MLEQQQAWLVHGLQKLYRRNIDGEGWPGDNLKLEPTGQPLTHDLLMRLGVLDGTKERFEENPESLQRDLWQHGMQRQESSDGDSSPHSPARSRVSEPFSHMPPTPPTYSSPREIKTEPIPQFAPMPMSGVVNPLALQGPPQWPGNGFTSFEEMDLMGDYSNISFDDPQLSPMFNRVPANCVPQGSYLDAKNDYEDFNQFLNPNPTEITSI